MRSIYKITADMIFVIHFFVLALAVLGWLAPSLWHFYMGVLILALLSDIILGYCFLSKWEFNLRKKFNPKKKYNRAWSTFYTRALTSKYLTEKKFSKFASGFLIFSVAANLFFKLWF